MKLNDSARGRPIKNGDLIENAGGWCDLCHVSFGGSMDNRPAMFLDGKMYHPTCYPQAVEIYLADLKLRRAESGKGVV